MLFIKGQGLSYDIGFVFLCVENPRKSCTKCHTNRLGRTGDNHRKMSKIKSHLALDDALYTIGNYGYKRG